MDWNVKNAVNRDVERQHLNKILKDIRSGQDTLSKRVDDAAGGLNNVQNNLNNTIIKIINNTLPPGDLATKVTLTGDVAGTSVPVPGQNAVTIQTQLTKQYLDDAPTDAFAYWRRSGQWERVNPALDNLTQIQGEGIVVWDSVNLQWLTREIVTADADRIVITDGDGIADNPVLDLALVPDDGTGVLQRTSFDAWGRRTGTAAATTDHLPEGTDNLYFTTPRAMYVTSLRF